MKYKSIGILLSLLAVSLSINAQRITLSQCLDATRKHFPTVRHKEVLTSMNDALQAAIWYSYLPQVSIEGSTSYQSHVTGVSIEAPPIPPLPNMPATLPFSIDLPQIPKLQYHAYIQATQLIWDGGAVKALGSEVKADTEIQMAQAEVDMRRVEDQVVELYFSLLMLDAQKELQELLRSEVGRQKKKVEAALNNGLATANQLDEVEVELLKVEQTMNQLSISRQTLLEALSVFTQMELSAGTIVTCPESPDYHLSTEGSERFAPLRPEHRLLDAQAHRADTSLRSFLSEGMPKVALFAQGGYGRPGLNMLDPNPSTFFTYGIRLNWNFGRLYGLDAQRQQSSGTKAMIELKREALVKEIQATLAKEEGEIQQYESLIQQDREIISIRERIAARAKVQNEEGTLSNLEYLAKVIAVNAAQQNSEVHRLQLLKSQYKRVQTLGYK